MAQMISGKDIARLHLDLEVPQIIADLLNRHEILSPGDEHLLRAQLAQLNSLEMLLSIACCFNVFVSHTNDDPTLIEPLQRQGDYILDDYAPYWMQHQGHANEEWMNFVHDDLETIGDFLSILSDAAHGLHPALTDICEILNEFAFLKSIEINMMDVIAPINVYKDNVIRFPTERRI